MITMMITKDDDKGDDKKLKDQSRTIQEFKMKRCSTSHVPIQKRDKFSLVQYPRDDVEQKQMEAILYASVFVASTMKAEFVACFEIIIQAKLVVKLYFRTQKMYCDNFATVFFSKNDKYSKGTKHM